MNLCAARWIAVRLYALSALFAGAIALYFVYVNTSISPSGVGFVLTVASKWNPSILCSLRLSASSIIYRRST